MDPKTSEYIEHFVFNLFLDDFACVNPQPNVMQQSS